MSKSISDLSKRLLDDSFGKERLLEHYRDEMLTANQQMFSLIAQARVLFPKDQKLDALVKRIENLTEYNYQNPIPGEMLHQTNINNYLRARQKRQQEEIDALYRSPIDELLNHLAQKIREGV